MYMLLDKEQIGMAFWEQQGCLKSWSKAKIILSLSCIDIFEWLDIE